MPDLHSGRSFNATHLAVGWSVGSRRCNFLIRPDHSDLCLQVLEAEPAVTAVLGAVGAVVATEMPVSTMETGHVKELLIEAGNAADALYGH